MSDPNYNSPITRIVDGGYLSWAHGAMGAKSWMSVRSSYSMHSGSLILLDSHESDRKKFYPLYKAHRKEQRAKREDVHEKVLAFQAYLREDPSLRKIECPGMEADDLVSILVSRYHLPVIGADKDLLQIPGIRMHHLDGAEVTEENFRRRLPKTIAPLVTRENVLLILTVLGDKSDDIPRLLPAGQLHTLATILRSHDPWEAVGDIWGDEALRNLSLAVLPSPWTFLAPPTPLETYTSVRLGTWGQLPLREDVVSALAELEYQGILSVLPQDSCDIW